MKGNLWVVGVVAAVLGLVGLWWSGRAGGGGEGRGSAVGSEGAAGVEAGVAGGEAGRGASGEVVLRALTAEEEEWEEGVEELGDEVAVMSMEELQRLVPEIQLVGDGEGFDLIDMEEDVELSDPDEVMEVIEVVELDDVEGELVVE